MKLEDIGFYTLSDARAEQASSHSPLWRCELLVTNKCNFNCPYCRGVGPKGNMSWDDAKYVFDLWLTDNLKNVRLSGGEPTLWPHIEQAVDYLHGKVERIAISTNGSAPTYLYNNLIELGVSDFSVSLDACCAGDNEKMTGGVDSWATVIENISYLAKRTYVTVGVVMNDDNRDSISNVISFAQSLGVSDIRVIPAAQQSQHLDDLPLSAMPILEYRRKNIREGVRGIRAKDTNCCWLVLDDMAVVGKQHYPCIIYAREGGKPIGKIGPNMRKEREQWSKKHDCSKDWICRNNCLDVCRDYNNRCQEINTIS